MLVFAQYTEERENENTRPGQNRDTPAREIQHYALL